MDDLLIIDNWYFDGLISHVYPSELSIKSIETKAPFLELNLSLLDMFISYKIYDQRDDFDFEIVIVFLLGWECSSSSILRYLYLTTTSVRQSIYSCY